MPAVHEWKKVGWAARFARAAMSKPPLSGGGEGGAPEESSASQRLKRAAEEVQRAAACSTAFVLDVTECQDEQVDDKVRRRTVKKWMTLEAPLVLTLDEEEEEVAAKPTEKRQDDFGIAVQSTSTVPNHFVNEPACWATSTTEFRMVSDPTKAKDMWKSAVGSLWKQQAGAAAFAGARRSKSVNVAQTPVEYREELVDGGSRRRRTFTMSKQEMVNAVMELSDDEDDEKPARAQQQDDFGIGVVSQPTFARRPSERSRAELQEAKEKLSPTKTRQSNALITEKPDAAVVTAAARSLKRTETVVKNTLPTAEDIAKEGAAGEVAAQALAEAKRGLRRTQTAERSRLPTMEDIQAEKQAHEVSTALLEEAKSKLHKVETVEKTGLIPEKPYVKTLQSAASKLKPTQTVVRNRLPTADDIQQEAAAMRGRSPERSEHQVRFRLPTADDILCVRKELSISDLHHAKGRLRRAQTCDRSSLIAGEKPDAAMVQAAGAKLRPTQVQEKSCLPTAEDLKAQGQAAEVAEKALADAKGKLRSTQTSERSRLPSAADISAEKQAAEMSEVALQKGRASLKPAATTDKSGLTATEKPDSKTVQAAAQRLTPTTTQEKNLLPTAQDLKTQGQASLAAEKALNEAKGKLKPAETQLRSRLPTADDILAEKRAHEMSIAALEEGKRRLRRTQTCDKTLFKPTEKPDAAMVKAAAQRLKPATTVERSRLPTADDIAAEQKAVAIAEQALKEARSRLRWTETIVRSRLPTAEDMKAEQQATEVSAAVLSAAKDKLRKSQTVEKVALVSEKPDAAAVQAAARKLKRTETVERSRLPTAEDIRAEREDSAGNSESMQVVRPISPKVAAETRGLLKCTYAAALASAASTTANNGSKPGEVSEDALADAKRSLKRVQTSEKNSVDCEKPDAKVVAAAAQRLKQTETQVKMTLPTAEDLASEGKAAQMAATILKEARTTLKSTETAVRTRLPSAQDIQAEREAQEVSAALLGDAKAKLQPVETVEKNSIATEKPDAKTVTAAAQKLKQTQTLERTRLPTAEDLSSEGAAEEAARKALQEAREKLKKAETVDRTHLPTASEIKAEKDAHEMSERILSEAKDKLKHAETIERVALTGEKPDAKMVQAAASRLRHTETDLRLRLPSAADIQAEKDEAAAEAALASPKSSRPSSPTNASEDGGSKMERKLSSRQRIDSTRRYSLDAMTRIPSSPSAKEVATKRAKEEAERRASVKALAEDLRS
eukprot:TRINITY_DN1318_c0_g1_i3.p1 TRINITY_DN1318_c0_g1~~TRINITY_DN1318_c0_g1_i3.p1  ORF type:complete len:1239 (-),score=428.73 TRINITY_DN1318_c0_g1_i3:366-4082(-)